MLGLRLRLLPLLFLCLLSEGRAKVILAAAERLLLLLGPLARELVLLAAIGAVVKIPLGRRDPLLVLLLLDAALIFLLEPARAELHLPPLAVLVGRRVPLRVEKAARLWHRRLEASLLRLLLLKLLKILLAKGRLLLDALGPRAAKAIVPRRVLFGKVFMKDTVRRALLGRPLLLLRHLVQQYLRLVAVASRWGIAAAEEVAGLADAPREEHLIAAGGKRLVEFLHLLPLAAPAEALIVLFCGLLGERPPEMVDALPLLLALSRLLFALLFNLRPPTVLEGRAAHPPIGRLACLSFGIGASVGAGDGVEGSLE